MLKYSLSAISTKPALINCFYGSPDVIRLVDKCQILDREYKVCTDSTTSLPRIMVKKSVNVFGRIDFYSVLQYLVISLGGSLEEELTKVLISFFNAIFTRMCYIMHTALNFVTGHQKEATKYLFFQELLSNCCKVLEHLCQFAIPRGL